MQKSSTAWASGWGLAQLGLCAASSALGLLRGRAALPLVRTVVSLGVAAIPEGLPAVATSLLATGIRTLRKGNVYARRLDAVENLGAIDVVGFDKTGTLTRTTCGDGVVVRQHVGASARRQKARAGCRRTGAGLCVVQRARTGQRQRVARILDRDGTGRASRGSGVDVETLRERPSAPRGEAALGPSPVHGDPPRERAGARARRDEGPAGRRAAALHHLVRRQARRAADGPAPRIACWRLNDTLARRGERVLALAIKRQSARKLGATGELTWLGAGRHVGPVRAGIAEVGRALQAAGIRPIMMTGDQLGTARAIARRAGLDGRTAR